MAQTKRGDPRRFLDPLTTAAAVFFLIAVCLAAAPAFRAGPANLAGLLLLAGLAGVAFIGLIAFRGGARELAPAAEAGLTTWLGALGEPSAVCLADGSIEAANAAWSQTVGAAARLPRTGDGLFAALTQARRGAASVGRLRLPNGEKSVAVSAFGPERFLLRLVETAPVAAPAPPALAPEPRAERSTPPQGGLDPFTAASPFGAALIDGRDPFSAPIVAVNSALATIAGDGAIRGANLGALMAPQALAEASALHAEGRPGPFEVSLAADPARTVQIYITSAGEARWVAYLLDVTGQKKMQLQLAQRNKMEAIGQLAGGVAHDFNNLLTAIQLRLDELLLRHPLGDPSYEGLSEIRQTGVRAADLVRQLLTFSRKATVQRETLDLGELISNFEVLLRRLLREDVRLVTDYGRDLPLVRADKAQLETAVMNLVVNARDAVHAAGGGAVRLRTARVTEAQAVALGFLGQAKGDLALIEVADDGPGMSAEVLANVFEPFFTTKAVGEGTGLGLATVYGIVKQSDGWISVVSTPGEGASFRIFLPVHIPPLAVETHRPSLRRPQAPRDLSGAGRILFVEDEDAVRGIAARLLRARGYEVIEAADGEEALALAEKHAGAIDLMISDVIMPGIDGPTLLKRARAFLGNAPVMFISGYAEAEFSELLEGESGVSFLAKPIDIKTLAEKVKQQLQAA